MTLPANHPQRFLINNEVHARPPQPMQPPQALSYIALFSDRSARDADWRPVADIATRYGTDPPGPGANHFSADLGPFRLRWERHTEFTRFLFIAGGSDDNPFGDPPLSAVPDDWLASLPGTLIVAAHAALVRTTGDHDYDAISTNLFDGRPLVGAHVGDGAAVALTDFHIRPDNFSRILVLDSSMTSRQAGRTMQRLLEIDTYRIMAFLALPVARDLTPFLSSSEQELASIATALSSAAEEDEPLLLERLTRLEAAIEGRYSDNHYRFSAAAAYYDLVRRRIDELREERIPGLQTFHEFTERRMAPAMNTCRAAAQRQEALSERVARATHLLSTRIAISRERQSQALLESMDRRAKLQLRLQQTVEGLSVAAITYYIVGLVGYLAKGLKSLGMDSRPQIVMAISIPLVAVLVAFGVRRVRKRLTRTDGLH